MSGKIHDTTAPREIAGRLLVSVRAETHTGAGMSIRMWRITHPNGRRRLSGTTNYVSAARAIEVAGQKGWTVLGVAMTVSGHPLP